MTVGNEDAEKQLRTALAMGCDQAVLLNVEDDLEEWDQFSASTILYHYFKDKEASLILAGNVAIDGGSGQVARVLLNYSAFHMSQPLQVFKSTAAQLQLSEMQRVMWK